jgi:hypothetical protein
MNTYTQFFRLLTISVLALAIACAPAAAQSASPSGTFGVLLNAQILDQFDNNGGAILGLLNFDGAGNSTGTYTLMARDQGGQTATGSLTGTYSTNPDGSGTASLSIDVGFDLTLAFVVSDGGHGLQFVAVDSNSGFNGGDAGFQGSAQTLTGSLPIAPFLPGAKGGIPLSLTGSSPANSGITIYTAAAATGSGTIQCDGGSTGPWNASVPNLTIVTHPDIPSLSGPGGPIFSASFFGVVSVTACGGGDLQFINGPVTGMVRPGGATNITIHKVADVLSGTGRIAAPGVSPKGSYAGQTSYSPYPAASITLLNLDGAGNLTGTVINQNGQTNSGTPPKPVNFTGTYSLNPDGTGTVSTTVASGQPGPPFAFVVTDGGAGLLLLQTALANGGNIAYGTARLQ